MSNRKGTPAGGPGKAPTVLDVARSYIERGWTPVPVPYQKKYPVADGWQSLNITSDNVATFFNGAKQNIGVQLGARSRGLTDVDLDCAEAVKLAPYFLPSTDAIFGRPSKPSSHYLYEISDPPEKAEIKLLDHDKGCVVELRMGGGTKGAQTVFPGSVHETGETIEWAQDGQPAHSTFSELDAAIRKIAAATILVRNFPPKGSRADAATALGGFLTRLGWDADTIYHFVEMVAHEAGSDDPAGRARDAASAVRARDEGKDVYGLPELINCFGEKPAKQIAKILGYNTYTALVGEIGKLPWRERSGKGKPVASLHNVRLGILAMGIVVRHDLFRDITIIGHAGDEMVHEIKPLVGELNNSVLLMLRQKFSVRFGFDPDDKYVLDAVKTLAFENCFDPILDFLSEAEADWDGVERLDTWAVKYLGCVDTPFCRAIGRKVLIAAVRRARLPGCKFDNITVLEGEEGKGKSTAISALAGPEFFSDQSILGKNDKEVQEQLCGVWMHESADLAGLKKADIEHVKSFASRQTDRARPAYGRVLERKPRRAILFATTNDNEYMQSQTGNRRFWPLTVGTIDLEALRRDRPQLFAEAAVAESAGESIVLDKALWPTAAQEQEKRRVRDPWEDTLADIPKFITYNATDAKGDVITKDVRIIYEEEDGDEWILEKVASVDLLTHVLRVPVGMQEKRHTMKLSVVMGQCGWKRPDSQKITINGKQVRGYCRRRLRDGPM